MKVSVTSQYLQVQSKPLESKYVFAYTVSIENDSDEAAKLVSRYWQITDANNQIQEVTGVGVVGDQPRLEPGETYTYTSGAVLETTTGTMQGHYVMMRDNGSKFEADIPTFALIQPQALH
ncbi:Co2+/Mg2+ efflux protein ApaG [Teredinibacter franksiae]|jgi:Uncharacterized protein affecting Mg2+/Co2+ transport|uniref:Co2+/Mg2+ efflux protein ApaG n=1 Tax=Teredinibacter franksiae TaxID=2761453 RepID=UPI001625379A|nr:Co2+/Mg2+ efflux protein ApaG [Teredinibacter franksiae]